MSIKRCKNGAYLTSPFLSFLLLPCLHQRRLSFHLGEEIRCHLGCVCVFQHDQLLFKSFAGVVAPDDDMLVPTSPSAIAHVVPSDIETVSDSEDDSVTML